jgi:hypothetical protein
MSRVSGCQPWRLDAEWVGLLSLAGGLDGLRQANIGLTTDIGLLSVSSLGPGCPRPFGAGDGNRTRVASLED